ncbi:Na+/H+ antiporter NhaA [Microbaculum marinisediminis]|uniref:Na(+)/H(+) antiporter NhaA n=1 Tax=Microbaculum marinisediminis TaxID=2931392 RepID=A0AAW5QUB6_9HYPH|nr:Na+/H+ antiporter NhaA [Microbaculum sp. A6E488]MCT8971661.1 Na+/H+ antiporter NhaA [Microbaculum sp. A6E488]
MPELANSKTWKRTGKTTVDTPDLPYELANRFTTPIARFLKVEAAIGLLLLLAAITAMTLANSPLSGPFLAFWETPIGLHFGPWEFGRSLQHWINDGLMTFFFFVVALELKRELVLGELRHPRFAALPLAGAVGGMLVPALLYLAFMSGKPGAHGWGTVMATDTAFVIGCLALFSWRIPPGLRLYLLSLAIFDDVGAILVVALGYGTSLNWAGLGFAIAGLAVVAVSARIGIRCIPVYFLFGGAIWLCVDSSGIHPTVAGVVLGLMTPTRAWVSDARLRGILERVLSYPIGDHWSGDTADRRDLRKAGVAVAESLSPVERLVMMLHPWVGFVIMPIFALANAGVPISVDDIGQPVSVAIVIGLVLGKPIGVMSFSWLAAHACLAIKSRGLSWRYMAAGALLTGIGFTMSLFVAELAYSPALIDAGKIGIFTGSVMSAVLGLSMLTWLTWRRPAA